MKDISKESRLLEMGFKLFTEKGIKSTSIQDIVDKADVGKGTFYLYFKDKYELRDVLIMRKSKKIFNDALNLLYKNNITDFYEQLDFIIDYVIDELTANPILLKFISKNLSWGVYNQTVLRLYSRVEQQESGLYELFLKGLEKNNITLKNPNVTLFMIVELISSTCFNSILYNEPLPIQEYKSYLCSAVKNLIDEK